jgi:TRAP-type transport system periplasmic protein
MRLLPGLAVASILALAAGALAAPAEADTLKLRMSVESTPGAPTQYILGAFRDALNEEMGDDVEIEYFDSGTLGDEIVHMEQVRTGQLDVYPLGSDAVTLDPKWAVFDMPFLFPDRETVARVLDGEVGEELDRSMQDRAGLKVLGLGELGFRHITNNVRPIVTPEDLRGLKIRVPGSQTRIAAFQAFGANPVTMNIGELYLAMQQGVIDGQENPLSNVRAWSWFEVQKHLSMSSHVYTPVTLVMNLRRYESLTDEERAAVDSAARKAVEASRQYGADNDVKLVEELKQLSGGRMEFNDIDLAAFRAAADQVRPMIAEAAGAEFTDKVIAAAGN